MISTARTQSQATPATHLQQPQHSKPSAKFIADLEVQLDRLELLPRSAAISNGSLETTLRVVLNEEITTVSEGVQIHNQNLSHKQSKLSKTHGSRLAQQLLAMRDHPEVIALDFGWNNFVTYADHASWGVIPNLNPARQRQRRDQGLREALKSVEQWRGAATTPSRARQLERITARLEANLEVKSGNAYQTAVRGAMLEALWTLTAPYEAILTETLDVAALYANPSKRAVIDDLGWWTLLEQLGDMAAERGQTLVLLPRHYSSLTCPSCRYSSLENRVRNQFRCQQCQIVLHPDVVALLNFQMSLCKNNSSRTVNLQRLHK